MGLADTDRPGEEQAAPDERQIIFNHDLGFDLGRPFRKLVVSRYIVLNRAVLITRRNRRRLKQEPPMIGRLTATTASAFAWNYFHSGSEAMWTVGARLIA